MPIKKFRPYTPTRRFLTVLDFKSEITESKPERSLVERIPYRAGHNNTGRITSRFRGGRHKRLYRLVDFKRTKDGIPATVKSVQYDPYRTANIALLAYADGKKAYILAPKGLEVGSKLMNGPQAEVRLGNCLPLANIPVGSTIHAIELTPGKGAQMVRSAGASAMLLGRDSRQATLRLPSGEIRVVLTTCRAAVGQVGNVDHELVVIGKAGRQRWVGRRPHNRGVAMNPIDHPMGGGEGRTSGGRHPCTPWGQKTKGLRTRKKSNPTSKYILKRRYAK
ncbi:50S ribosomal protein L2 [bacterium]|nr:50S ribosomal protein L2 [bacterium]